jgi:hypothetical protein
MPKFRVFRQNKTLYFLDIEAKDITEAKVKANTAEGWERDETVKTLISFPHYIEEIKSSLKTGEK